MAAGQVGVLVTTESQVALFARCMEALICVVDDEEHKITLREVCDSLSYNDSTSQINPHYIYAVHRQSDIFFWKQGDPFLSQGRI